MRVPGAVGLGNTVPDFWISAKDNCPRQELHFAFAASGELALGVFLLFICSCWDASTY